MITEQRDYVQSLIFLFKKTLMHLFKKSSFTLIEFFNIFIYE